MENTGPSKYAISFGLSLALVSVLNALLVMVKEKNRSLMGWMQKATGHQWVTHAAVMLVLFVFFGWVFSRRHGGKGPTMVVTRLITVVVGGILAGSAMIIGFYLFAD